MGFFSDDSDQAQAFDQVLPSRLSYSAHYPRLATPLTKRNFRTNSSAELLLMQLCRHTRSTVLPMANLTATPRPKSLCRFCHTLACPSKSICSAGFAGAFLDRIVETKGVCNSTDRCLIAHRCTSLTTSTRRRQSAQVIHPIFHSNTRCSLRRSS